jgi:alpha-L-rhamnosidase
MAAATFPQLRMPCRPVILPHTRIMKRFQRTLLCFSLLLFAPIPSALARVTVEELRCENLENPLGIDATQPRLSWMLKSSERNQKQTAWRVLVASSPAKLKAGNGDLWDSGKVASDQSIQLPYAGKPLASQAECFWKVRVWDKNGRESAWSEPARWTMGQLQPADWKAKWIGLDGEDRTNILAGTDWIWFPEGEPQKSAAPATNFFRRVITLPAGKTIRRAFFQYTGDSECRGWINDRDLGARNNFHTVKYNDITTRIEPGRTYVFGLTGRNVGPDPKPAGVVGLIEIEFTDGERLVVATDEQWKVSNHETAGWNTLAFDDSSWVAAKKLGPVGMQPWGEVQCGDDRRLPARWLRKEFTVEKKIRRATVSFSGLGSSELYLNGTKVGDDVLSPGATEYPKRVFYVTHDVTRQLQRGRNAIGVVLGNGRFYSMRNRAYSNMPSYGFPKLLLQLRVEFEDGSVSEIVSDESWSMTTDGPIVANNEYDGEEYDARLELGDWSEAGYALPFSFFLGKERAGVRGEGVSEQETIATSTNTPHPSPLIPLPSEGRGKPEWRPVQFVSVPAGVVAAQMIEPIRVTQTLKPISVAEPKPGVFIFDLGQNLVGWCCLKVSGKAGTHVTLRHAETLNADGTLYFDNLRGARVTDIYTLKGKGTEIWEPRFTYHGFRYVEVTGFPGRPTLAAIAGRVVHDDLPSAGDFTCSNPLVNRIYQNIVWGTKGNYRSLPTDCPQRDERQGWLGDRSEESKGESFIFDTQAFHEKWLQDMADAQRASGSVPDVCPSYWPLYNDDVTWPSSTVIIPHALREQFGDTTIVARHYDSAKKWVDYMQRFVSNGIISKDNYGDWCVPPEDPKLIHSLDPNRITDKALLATAYFYHDLKLMEGYAKMLGKDADARHFAQLAEQMKTAFNEKFLKRNRGQYDNGTQTSCVLPLAFGLVPDDLRGKVFDHLVEKITVETKGHIGTGLIGGQYLMRVLSDNGRPDLAWTIATQKDYPGWGYMVGKGATTIWELWNGDTADPAMNSGNHVMLVGDLVIWLYENLAGIKADPAQPGFKHIIMKPTLVDGLNSVKATHRSPYGPIVSEWKRDGAQWRWHVEIPPNATATLYMPTPSFSVYPALRDSDRIEGDDKEAGLRIGSGSFDFRSN